MVEFSHPTLVSGSRSGNPLECRDEIWRQKTKIVGIPDSEEIMTQYRRVPERRTDRHVTIVNTRSSITSRW